MNPANYISELASKLNKDDLKLPLWLFLNYMWSTAMFLVLTASSVFHQWYNNPLQCTEKKGWSQEALNDYCFTSNLTARCSNIIKEEIEYLHIHVRRKYSFSYSKADFDYKEVAKKYA